MYQTQNSGGKLLLQATTIVASLLAAIVLFAGTAHAAGVEIEMVETGRGNTSSVVEGELVFRVRAVDTDEGDDDGDGIRSVDLIIEDEDEREVYRRREQNPGYCAFAGGEPNCNVYVFNDNNNRWPDDRGRAGRGEQIRDGGEYTLYAIANTDDGRSIRSADTVVEVRLSSSEPSPVVIEMIETGDGNTDDVVEEALVFRVRAFDTDEGDDDGDGIRSVDLIIEDENEREVYRRREQNPGYCAFAGGEPNCNVYVFNDNNNRWPDNRGRAGRGERVRNGGEYTLYVIVNTDDGRSIRSADTVVEVRY